VLLLFVLTGLVVPPLLPILDLRLIGADSLGHAPRAPRVAPHVISVQAERERLAARARLFALLRQRPAPPALRYRQMPVTRTPRRADRVLAAHPPEVPIVVGFYVNWDDNSLASLRTHIDSLHWVVGEWGFVGRGGDSVSFAIDRRVLALAALAKTPPLLFAMVTNFTGDDWDGAAVARIVERPAARRRAIATIVGTLRQYDLAGVTVDFEQIAPTRHPALVAFIRDLRAALRPEGRLVTQAVPGDDPAWPLAAYAAVTDRLFVMLYDEHDPSDNPGPVASQGWFEHHLARILATVPPGKVIVGIGQYGYEWADTAASATELTFQDAMQLARDHQLTPSADRTTVNPTFSWADPDSTSHIVWYLDGVTAWNQIRRAAGSRVAGFGIWRLGSEDPSLWSVIGRGGVRPSPAPLDTIRIGYDVAFVGTGEILRMVAKPTLGMRSLGMDSATGFIASETVLRTPSTYVIRRYGRRKNAVALTFDDGPDPSYTPAILDTLRSRGASATFFVIGENAELHPDLLRRELREGHEIGNHTFTHPNLALVGREVIRLELTAAERMIEAILNRRTALFRPPYFGDAEPTTADELEPIAIAQELGYVTVGLRDDPGDWETPGVDSIIRRALDQLDRGNIILLHDGGGNRDQTVAALGPLIDSLRARGVALTTVTALAGIPPGVAMAPLAPGSAVRRFVELTSFSLVGWIELGLHALFLVAMVLGGARLVFMLALALRQRYARRLARRAADAGYRPSVSVVVPAFNEERVVGRTVASLLAQDYEGLEIVVVDDGSTDRTRAVLVEAFQHDPRVRIFTQVNGGKASALNLGLAQAKGDVVVAVDADTIFAPGAITAVIAPLADPRVGA
jgi:peptidoglycan/xylan/chitin deacetylase (PgdA/CDA1 family)/spore germination protein YaaH